MAITPNVVVSQPSQLFTLARSFKANANGKIYIGAIDTDPTIPSNQIQVYIENEDGSHVPADQPLKINSGGFPVYNGQQVKFVTVQGHSMAIYDAYNVQQFYFPNVLKYDPDQLRQELNSPIGAGLVLNKLGKTIQAFIDDIPSVFVSDFISADRSFSQSLQLAIDSVDGDNTGNYGAKIILPRGRFRITDSIFIYEKDGCEFIGAGDGATILEIDSILSSTLPAEFENINGTYRGYTYNQNAIFIVAARRITQVSVPHDSGNGAAWRLSFGNFSVEASSDAYKNVSVIYAPEIGLSNCENITAHNVRCFANFADIYNTTLKSIYTFNVYSPVVHGVGSISQGTSLNLEQCVASKCEHGWKFSGLGYSSFNNVACDGWADGYAGNTIQHYAYDFNNCNVTMNGCGCESVQGTAFGTFNIHGGSSITLDNCALIGGRVTESLVNQSFIDGPGTILTISGTQITQGASVHLGVLVSNGANAIVQSMAKQNLSTAGSLKITDFHLDDKSGIILNGSNNYLVSSSRDGDFTANLTNTNVSFNKKEIDTLSVITSASFDAFPVRHTGLYRVTANLGLAGGAATNIHISVNNVIRKSQPIPATQAILDGIIECNTGDIIRIVISQSTSGLIVKSGSFMSIQKI
ncbi:phage head-binding domain-containing protein [Pectobacterium parmentieri]|uniref:phage head-binding domain-containing protein n=1 Tax=Pectobacterium parmentieri TaxID=1905730 RepID=UPI001E4A51B5|nr:phage head-binding domain-containing protein [Pectobacterium parmentieri]